VSGLHMWCEYRAHTSQPGWLAAMLMMLHLSTPFCARIVWSLAFGRGLRAKTLFFSFLTSLDFSHVHNRRKCCAKTTVTSRSL
jgi:hypothetical protein